MATQTYKNHRRYLVGWHGIVLLMLLGLLGGALNFLMISWDGEIYAASLLVLTAVILNTMYWYIRSFALRAQDRAIRAEENFRHFVLTGKPLDSKIRMGQIISLRFASDAEFPALARRAADENLSASEIKQQIRNWRGDYYRV